MAQNIRSSGGYKVSMQMIKMYGREYDKMIDEGSKYIAMKFLNR